MKAGQPQDAVVPSPLIGRSRRGHLGAGELGLWIYIPVMPAAETFHYAFVPTALGRFGIAWGRNPIPILIPCHRIVAASGKLVGFSAPGKLVTKQRRLEIEGALAGNGPSLFDPIEPKQPPDGATTW